MAFKTKVDYFGLADTNLIETDESINETQSVAEATDAHGDVIASTIYGQTAAPSETLKVKGSVAKDVVLGGVTTVDSKYYCLTGLTITTSAGAVPQVTASGEEVPSATPSTTYTVDDGLTVSPKAMAQLLQSAFTLTGAGCNVTDCSIEYSCKLAAATKDGDKLAWDCTDGRAVVKATINQTGAVVPTIEAATGWSVTTKLTSSNPDSDYPTWTVALTKYLTKDAAAA